MRFSNDNSTWSGWETYATTKNWTLAGGDGTRTVYAQFSDDAGNITSAQISDAIGLDTTLPTASVDKASGQADPTNAKSIAFTAVFSEHTGERTCGRRFHARRYGERLLGHRRLRLRHHLRGHRLRLQPG